MSDDLPRTHRNALHIVGERRHVLFDRRSFPGDHALFVTAPVHIWNPPDAQYEHGEPECWWLTGHGVVPDVRTWGQAGARRAPVQGFRFRGSRRPRVVE